MWIAATGGRASAGYTAAELQMIAGYLEQLIAAVQATRRAIEDAP